MVKRVKSFPSAINDAMRGAHERFSLRASMSMSSATRWPLRFHICEGVYFPITVSVIRFLSRSGSSRSLKIPTQSDHEKCWLKVLLTLSSPSESVKW